MGVKTKTVKNDFPQMQKTYESLSGKKVQVGVFGEQAWLAGIHEYGCNIPVTDKMRAYLASQGLHLKQTTTEIHIPERSFLRSGYDANRDDVLKKTETLISALGIGLSAEDLCETLGIFLAGRIKDFAVDLKKPAKHPFTLKQNGRKENPLVNSGDMINAITYRVE